MRAQEYAVAAAVTAEGAYLVAASLGLAPLTAYLAAGIPLIAFGLLYMALGDRRASLWGGVTALAGMALGMGGRGVAAAGPRRRAPAGGSVRPGGWPWPALTWRRAPRPRSSDVPTAGRLWT